MPDKVVHNIPAMDLETGEKTARAPVGQQTGWRILKPFSQLDDKRNLIRKFSPSMFLLSTCTGLIGLLFSVNPYLSTSWSTPLAFGFWWLSVVLFLICLTMVSLRCILHWETIAILPKNHSFDLFFAGYILISFGILVEGFVRYCPHYIGSGFYTVAIVFWWITAVLSHIANILIPFYLAYYHSRTFAELSTLWLLAMFPGVVIGVAGPVLAAAIPSISQARHILYMTYLLLGAALPLVLVTLGMLLARFFFMGLPPVHFIVSVFLPAAPMALFGLTFLQLGVVSTKIFPPELRHAPFLDFANPGLLSCLTVVAFMFLGSCIWFLTFGMLVCLATAIKNKGIPFTTGWWGGVFPTGLAGLLAVELGVLLGIDALKIVGSTLSVFTGLLGAYCTARTSAQVYSGVIFNADI